MVIGYDSGSTKPTKSSFPSSWSNDHSECARVAFPFPRLSKESWGSSVAWRWFLRMWPMSWWRWTCSERGACSFNLPRPSSLWAEETLFLSVFTFFWGLFNSPTLFAATGRSTTNLFMISVLSRTIDFFFLSLWIYLWLAETSQQPISQTTWLKVIPHCNHYPLCEGRQARTTHLTISNCLM